MKREKEREGRRKEWGVLYETARTTSRFTMVDLAGSERPKNSSRGSLRPARNVPTQKVPTRKVLTHEVLTHKGLTHKVTTRNILTCREREDCREKTAEI